LGQRELARKEIWEDTGNGWESASATQSVLGYDSLGQITNSTVAGNSEKDRGYSYDSIGNRLTATGDDGTTSYWGNSDANQAGANPANQYVRTTFPSAPAVSVLSVHDLDGNMTSGPLGGSACTTIGMPDPTAFDLAWDAENRLVKATHGTNTVTYDYDYLGRLISRNDGTNQTFYLYDGWNRIAEYSRTGSATPTLSKVNLWGLDVSGTQQGAGGVGGLLSILFDVAEQTRYYPAFDGNGNVIAYLDSAGDPVACFEYDPFGNLTADSEGNAASFPFRFSTKPQDPTTGLYYYGYRYYDPVTGRWPSRDPIEERGGANLYGFVGNDGVDEWDYIGLLHMEMVARRNGAPHVDGARARFKGKNDSAGTPDEIFGYRFKVEYVKDENDNGDYVLARLSYTIEYELMDGTKGSDNHSYHEWFNLSEMGKKIQAVDLQRIKPDSQVKCGTVSLQVEYGYVSPQGDTPGPSGSFGVSNLSFWTGGNGRYSKHWDPRVNKNLKVFDGILFGDVMTWGFSYNYDKETKSDDIEINNIEVAK